MWVEFVGVYTASRSFTLGTPVFPSPQKTTFPNSNSILECTGISNELLWTPGAPCMGKQIIFFFTSSSRFRNSRFANSYSIPSLRSRTPPTAMFMWTVCEWLQNRKAPAGLITALKSSSLAITELEKRLCYASILVGNIVHQIPPLAWIFARKFYRETGEESNCKYGILPGKKDIAPQ